MAALENAKHEAVAQAYLSDPERIGWRAYQKVYPNSSQHASETGFGRLLKNAEFTGRIDEITITAAEAVGVTVKKVLGELAKIAFSDIRKAVQWHGNLVREQDQPDGGDVLVIKEIFSNHVRLVDSDKVEPDIAAAISEVRQNATGGVSIKLHDKRAALVDLGKHLNLFKEQVEVTGKDGGAIQHSVKVIFVKGDKSETE